MDRYLAAATLCLALTATVNAGEQREPGDSSHLGSTSNPLAHGDPKVKACRIFASEQPSSDRIESGPQGRQAAPLVLDGVMYLQPRLRGRDVSRNAVDKTPSYRNRQGTSELGIIDTCSKRPRYY